MGEQKKDSSWDFKVPEDRKKKIHEKIKSKNPTLEASDVNRSSLNNSRKKLTKPEGKLSIQSPGAMNSRRSSRSQLAQQYNIEERMEKLHRTSVLDRVVAGLLDILYIAGIVYCSKWLVPLFKKEYMSYLVENNINQMLAPSVLDSNLWVGAGIFCFVILYIIPTIINRRSIGKAIKGHRIGQVSDGVSLSLGKAFVREFILRPISLITVIGVAMMFFNKKKQTLHDSILGTTVYSN